MLQNLPGVSSYDTHAVHSELPLTDGLPDAWRNQGFGYGDQPCVRFGKQQLFWKSVSGIYEMYASGVQKKVRSCLKNRKLFSKYVSKYAID